MRTFPNKTCERCGKEFSPSGSSSKVCFDCSGLHKERPCEFCGNVFTVKHADNKYCSHKCSAKDRIAAILSEDGQEQKCRVCAVFQPLLSFRKHRNGGSLRTECRECESKRSHNFFVSEDGKKYRRDWQTKDRKSNPEIHLWRAAKKRASSDKLPFDIEVSDVVIPEFCPVFGTKLFLGTGHPTGDSPTIDKRIPVKGYVKNNISIISYRANSIKRDASLEELKRLVSWMEKEEEN